MTPLQGQETTNKTPKAPTTLTTNNSKAILAAPLASKPAAPKFFF
jgi:hypothetical protein